MAEKRDSLTRFSKLVNEGDEPDSSYDDEKLEKDIGKILDYAQKLAGDNIFDVQMLVEAAAEELRVQIRDSVEGEDGDVDE